MTTAEKLIDTIIRLGHQPSEYVVDQTSDQISLTWRSGDGPTIEQLLSDETQESLPPAVREWTPGEFLGLFTDAEQLEFCETALIVPAIMLLQLKLTTANIIRSNSAGVLAGMAALVSVGVLTQSRANEILGVA